MAKPFEVPWTINDENEFGVAFLPWYFTNPELRLAAISVIACYLAFVPLLGTRLWTIASALVTALLLIQRMMAIKKGRSSSWLWDLRLAWGLLGSQRGLLRPRRGIVWLSLQHVPRPAPFLSGQVHPGGDLSVSAPWLVAAQPLVDVRLMMTPRHGRSFVSRPCAAPSWFLGANGFVGLLNPRIPAGVELRLIVPCPATSPADSKSAAF